MSSGARCTTADALGELRGADLGAWLDDEFAATIGGCDGLFVATGTAGAAESVGFWDEVTDRGARLANPRIFPWTLASAPAGHLAMTGAVRGPVINFVGGAEAAVAAIESAVDHLDDGLVQRAAVVAVDRLDGRTIGAALVLDAADHAGAWPSRTVIGADGAVAHLAAVHAQLASIAIG